MGCAIAAGYILNFPPPTNQDISDQVLKVFAGIGLVSGPCFGLLFLPFALWLYNKADLRAQNAVS